MTGQGSLPAENVDHRRKGAIVTLDDVWARYDERWVLKSVSLKCFAGCGSRELCDKFN